MELLSVDIPFQLGAHKSIVIAPLGDIQWAGERGPTAKDRLQRHIDKALEAKAWFLGLGDYIDFMSPSNRQRYEAAALYDNAKDVIDDKALDLVLELYQKFLKPTKGRWLGMLHGHHYAMLRSGETTDQRLCQLLGTRFLGTAAYIRLQFTRKNTAQRSNVVLWAHHGRGGGVTVGAPLNTLDRIAAQFPAADVYIMGHTTKRSNAPQARVLPRWSGKGSPDLSDREYHLVNSGGFAKGWKHKSRQGRIPMGDYVELDMKNPAALGAPLIHILPRQRYIPGQKSRNGDWDPEITVEN